MNYATANTPIHINYYLAPTDEVAKRIANIKAYYYMEGLRAQVRKQAIDNDDSRTLLITSLYTVDVDEETIGALFTSR